jgi:hypothetical protein
VESVHELCCCRNYLILRRGQWVGEIFVLEKAAPEMRGACCRGSKCPTLMLFGGRSQDKSFCAVFSVGFAFVWFVVDQCFHANGDKGVPIVIVVSPCPLVLLGLPSSSYRHPLIVKVPPNAGHSDQHRTFLPHKVLRMNQEDLVISQGGWIGFVVG